MTLALSTTLHTSFTDAVERTRKALSEQGFGVLTEIDMKATLKAKLGEDMEDYVILGACNPPLAHQALQADPDIGLLLPCNVVVREEAPGRVVVGFLDPQIMVQLTNRPEVRAVAEQAEQQLRRAARSWASRIDRSRVPDSPTPGHAVRASRHIGLDHVVGRLLMEDACSGGLHETCHPRRPFGLRARFGHGDGRAGCAANGQFRRSRRRSPGSGRTEHPRVVDDVAAGAAGHRERMLSFRHYGECAAYRDRHRHEMAVRAAQRHLATPIGASRDACEGLPR